MLRAVSAQVPAGEQQAQNFFDWLDADRYGVCKLWYYNRENRAATRTTSGEEAYQRASEYIRPTPTRRFDVFNATTGRDGRGDQASGGRGHGSDSSTKRWGTCHGCGEKDHYIRDCPNIDEAAEEEKKTEESKATENEKKSEKPVAITRPFIISKAKDREQGVTNVCVACDSKTGNTEDEAD